jgi:hypothetical protein
MEVQRMGNDNLEFNIEIMTTKEIPPYQFTSQARNHLKKHAQGVRIQ